MAWIKSDQSLANHPKLILLARALGISKVEALGHLHLLWYWVLEYADDGELRYLDLIPDACEWTGDQQLFLDALIEYGFIDTTYDSETSDTEYHVHDWLDYSGALYEKRLYNRLKKQESREKMVQEEDDDDIVTNSKYLLERVWDVFRLEDVQYIAKTEYSFKDWVERKPEYRSMSNPKAQKLKLPDYAKPKNPLRGRLDEGGQPTYINVKTNTDYVEPLMNYFNKREKRN